MKLSQRAWGSRLLVACCLSLAAQGAYAQRRPAPNSIEATREVLIQKARDLEVRGRPDMSLQLWEQVLLSDPNNTAALAGVARDYKLMGQNEKAASALNRLRQVSPSDPDIARIQALSSTQTQSRELQRAGALASQGKPAEAMSIYRQLYGNQPPPGPIALAYYQTLYATDNGKQEAIAGLRGLVRENPGNSTYAIALGTLLTYEARTRAEGIRILQAHAQDPDAQTALRQALLWNAANPATAEDLRRYLQTHPQDVEVAKQLRTDEAQLARMRSGIARTPAERAAFAALNSNHLDLAERRFDELLQKEPNNGRVLAGMGFLRMKQQNFGAAISYLSQAEDEGYKARTVQNALENSRFWYTMGEASLASNSNQFGLAQIKYREALAMNPRSPEALNGLAGLLVQEQQYPQAVTAYEQLLRVQPRSADGWRGLFLSQARAGENDKALATRAHFPASVRAAMDKDPDYLSTLAAIYQSQGRTADAEHVLAQALQLPFPKNGSALSIGTRLQYAGLLMSAKRYSQAVGIYTQVLNQDPSNLSAWEGLISAHHNLSQDSVAISEVRRIPAAVYESALLDPAFLATLGAIYQQANQLDVAQGFLERAERLQTAAGGQPSVDLKLQLASIYLLRNYPNQAYAIYRQVLAANPNNAGAWQGLINTLQTTNRSSQALQEIAQIPPSVRKQLESNITFVQTEASLYAATGNIPQAQQYMNQVEAYYSRLRQQPPADIDIQNAWLLYNTGNDRALYRNLMRIGGRTDLTLAQRETVQSIWASWSVRRAAQAMDNGEYRHAIEILDAAKLAFPNNVAVRKAVAGGYAQIGRGKDALALFKTIPMQDASSGDFQGAIGAALAANDKNQAEIWLRQALDRYPRDPAILSLAAQYEQARGDNQRAADYYRASLAAMPQATPAERLAHILVHPEEDTRPHKAVTAADLQRLLNPENERFPRTVNLPALPAYGPDPYNGTAPVILAPPPAQSPQQNGPILNSPASDEFPGVAPAQNPAIQPIPNGALQAPTIFLTPEPVSSGGTGAGQLGSMAAAPLGAGVPNVPIVANPPQSLASNSWKGLIFSLMSGGRNAEALAELNKMPPAVRTMLESDIQFVQGVASLYAAVGDTARAQAYMTRAESFYLTHRGTMPAALEIQHAWLLYNLKDDVALYPVMQSLDARTDLTPTQRANVQSLWASWAVRRASDEMNHGSLARGVELLVAASQDYPDNMNVRRAVAGAYARVGRATDALALYKAIPMGDATPGDYSGAISAAISARDMAQAETWLRAALARYPKDPQVLSLAAQFEQARGDNVRATEFWRAAIAAMPPGSEIKPLPSVVPGLAGSYQPPAPGDSRRLLDPRLYPLPTPSTEAPLPSYNSPAPTPSYASPSNSPQPTPWISQPSGPPLPLPSQLGSEPPAAPSPGAQLYLPRGNAYPAGTGKLTASQPQFVQQSMITGASAPSNNDVQRFDGRMNLPAGEQNVQSMPPGSTSSDQMAAAQSEVHPALPAGPDNPGGNLRIESEPMGPVAAHAQEQFSQQTDSQLTQGSASVIHNLPNSPAVASAPPLGEEQYVMAQYTPSAQDAVTGAYSSPNQPARQPVPTQQKPAPTQPETTTRRRRRRPTRRQSQQNTLGNAPIEQNAEPLQTPPGENPPAEAAPIPQQPAGNVQDNNGLTDQELEERNLPPLRGPWVRMQRQAPPLSPRDQAEMQLQAIESGYSGWLGGTGVLNNRSGNLGFDHLSDLEAPFEASAPMGYHARITVIARPVFLDSGQADGTAIMSVQESTISGTSLTTIPEPIGTLTTTDTTPPPQQNAAGLGGEVQLAFPQFAIAAGYTPWGFLVSTFTARLYWKPGNGPFTFNFSRDSQTDSQLSYSGLRDPAGTSLGTEGAIWGGVVANAGEVQFARGGAQSGYYFAAGGQYLTGYNVEKNSRFDGTGGAYWRAWTDPEYGNLSIGVNFFAMHYAHNENAFTYGMGGYFSPQAYFLGNVPVTWAGHYDGRWHYNVMGAIGLQAFQQNATPLWPLSAQKSLETSQNNPFLPALTSVSANYNLSSEAAYQISPHWFAGGYLGANNSRNYNEASVGFFIRYLFRSQPSSPTTPTGLFPYTGFRPFTVP